MLRALLLVSAVALIAGALTSAAAVGPPPACTNKALGTTQRAGYWLMCRPGGAVVWVMGKRVYINRSYCVRNSSVHFGRVRWNSTSPATNNLSMRLEPLATVGPVKVIDGSVELVMPDRRVVAGTVRGHAYVKPTIWQGTFLVTVHSRTFGPLKLTGRWTCG